MTEERDTTQEQGTPTPEEQVAEAVRNIPRENLEIEVEEYDPNNNYEFSTFDDLKSSFPDRFVVNATFKGKRYKLLCQRKHPYEIYGQEDFDRPENREVTSHEVFMDAIKVMLAVPIKKDGDPMFTEDQLMRLPMSLVSQFSTGIMREISPRFVDENTRLMLDALQTANATEGA